MELGVSSRDLEGAEGIGRKQVGKGQEKETYNRLGKNMKIQTKIKIKKC